MNIISYCLTMKDSELRQAYEEFREHEKIGFLQEGIIRALSDQLGEKATNVFEAEYALLREMASRWYHKS